MKSYNTLGLLALLALMPHTLMASSLQQEIMNYCQSMVQPGTPDDEARQIIDSCVNEQNSYAQDSYSDSDMNESDYSSSQIIVESEPAIEEYDQGNEDYDQGNDALANVSSDDCYQRVDEEIQQQLESNPDFEYDYDMLLDNCFNQYN